MKKAKDKEARKISGLEWISQRNNHLLGANIKRMRIERGLRNRDIVCQLQLRGIEIYSSSYSKLEAGKFNPTVDIIRALTHIYQCGYEEFFRE